MKSETSNITINNDALFSGLSRRRMLSYYLLGVLVFYIWYQATVNVMYEGKLLAYNGFADFIIGSLVNGTMILILFLINTWIVFGLKWKRNKFERFLLDFIISQASPVVINLLFLLFAYVMGKYPYIEWLQTFVLNFMILMLNETVFFVANYKHSQQKYEASQRLTVQLEYDVLRTQVNPHFLFNSLNILYSLTHIDIAKSQEFVLSLSRMYRYIMSRRDKATESLSHEMEFLQSYVDVLKMLYFDCFDIEITGKNDEYDNLHLIPYSLQLLIENVTKHNVIGRDNPMRVSIHITDEGLTVSNPVTPRQDGSGGTKDTGIGLTYLTKLYQLHGGNFEVRSDNGNFTVFVPFINEVTYPES